MNSLFIEAESFEHLGGWLVDSQSMESIHSSYIMAHGMGVPVEDATTKIVIEKEGEYSVWALTRDWTAVWDVKESAGKFTVKIDGDELSETLGTNGAKWAFQKAGKLFLNRGEHTLSLCDKTGFNARCDALYLTESDEIPSSDIKDIDALRAQEISDFPKIFDLVVVGGGIAGICTALTALRSGVSVALVCDRAVLGGCNSSEIRVCMGGKINMPPYEKLGTIVKEIAPIMGEPRIYEKEYFEDNRKAFAFELTEGKKADYKIFYNTAVTDVEREGKRITAVYCTDTLSGKKTKICAKLFSDCSGDGVVARKMDCETMYGREAERVFKESLAPKETEKLVMGHSIRWYSEETNSPCDFPDIDWNLKFSDDSCLNCVSGDWEQETGFTRDMVSEIEYIRDYGLRAIYSNWAYQKHHFKDKENFKNRKLVWVSHLGGKREGYRVCGDLILNQNDIEDFKIYDDATACMTWSIDMHFPEPTNEKEFKEAFRSFAYHRGIVKPYPVPYRCLYARDAENLFLGGRIVSMSHVAFSAVRVMRTLGALGEVVGLASCVCREKNCTPREVYTKYLDEFKQKLIKGPPSPNAFECDVGVEEAYHFKDIGWWWLNTEYAQNPSEVEKFKRGVKALGLKHKYPMPKDWE